MQGNRTKTDNGLSSRWRQFDFSRFPKFLLLHLRFQALGVYSRNLVRLPCLRCQGKSTTVVSRLMYTM